MSYSQSEEEKYILEYFGDKKGNYLDIGSYDGKTFSNTYQLVLNGWTGVSIEASPLNFVNMQKLYKDLPIKIVCGAMNTDLSGIIKFFDSSGDAIGTTETENHERWNKLVKFQEIYITQFSIGNFIKNFGTDFDFISIDTEGTSAVLFERMIPLFNPSLWCVEVDSYADRCVAFANNVGYKEIYRSGENIIFGK